jgi:hypothetical protein
MTIVDYQEKQRGRYSYALAQGRPQVAHDALWRAASDANLLEHWETGEGFSDERVQQLVQQLGWV